MKRFLFICYGNVGRSQIAQAYANHFAGQDIAMSAGTTDVKGLLGNHPLANVVAVTKEDGIDISEQKVQAVTETMLDEVEKIVVLSKKTDCPDYIIRKNNVIYHEFLDPYEQDIPTTRKIRDEIKSFVSELLHQ